MLNKRLQCIRSHIPEGIGVIDVGTDHGYLPVALAEDGYRGRLFASDIRKGPLSAAEETAEQAGMRQRIAFQLCDGLSLCPPDQVDCIVIAGMGGDTICGILDRAEWCMDSHYTMVLQPMTKAEVVRYWLVYNEFAIEEEDLVEDAGVIYSVIIARFGGKTVLSDAELYSGSFELIRSHPLFRDWIDSLCSRFSHILSGLRSADKPNVGRIKLTETILQELMEMQTWKA